METSLNQSRFYELDVLRGMAALFVVFFHFTLHHMNLPLYSVFRLGDTGVDLFFLISGFVIFQSIRSVESGAEFLINRFSRLYPPYWVAMTFTFLILYVENHMILGYDYKPDWGVYFYNLTMFQYYFNVGDIDGAYWTLLTEMVFYLLMFVLIVTKLVRFTVPLLCLLVGLTMIVAFGYELTAGQFYWDYSYNFPLSRHLPLFLAGIIFYKIKVENCRKWRYYLLAIACCFIQGKLQRYGARTLGFMTYFEYTSVLIIYFVLFFLFAFGKLKWIVNPITLFLGKISYSLYLTHMLFSINFMIPELLKLGVNYYIAAFLITLPACLLIASAITFTIERKFSPLLRKWVSKLLLERLPAFFNRSALFVKIKGLASRI